MNKRKLFNNKKRLSIIIGTVILSIILVVIFSSVAVRSTTVKKSVELGNKYIAEGNYKEAIIAFEKVIKIDNKNKDVKETLDVLYVYEEIYELYEEGKLEEAQEKLEEIKDMPKFDIIKDFVEELEGEVLDQIDLENQYKVGDSEILQVLNTEEIIRLNKSLTRLSDGFSSYDRDNYNTSDLINSIYICILKNESNLLQEEYVNGIRYDILTKEMLEEKAKELFNIEVDHSEFIERPQYTLEVINNNYGSDFGPPNEMSVSINMVDKITKVDTETYKIEFTWYDVEEYEYMYEKRSEVIEKELLDKCRKVASGIAEVKEYKVNDGIKYYYNKYTVNFEAVSQ